MNQPPIQPDQKQNNTDKKTPVWGILSTVFGATSLVPFLGIVSPLGLIFGIVALIKKQGVTAIIGTVLSGVGIVTSPILWGLVACAINPEECRKAAKEANQERTMEKSFENNNLYRIEPVNPSETGK